MMMNPIAVDLNCVEKVLDRSPVCITENNVSDQLLKSLSIS